MSVREKSAAALCLAIITFSILYPRSSFFRQRSYNLDEGTTAVCARVLLDGRMLYKDVVDSRPPLTHLAYALIFKRFGLFDLRSVHIALAALVAVLALLVYALGARIGGWRAGSAAALLFAAASFNYNSWDVLAFHTEWLMILFTAAAALCFLRGLSDGRRAWFVSAGASYALAVFSKQPAFLDFAAGVLFLCAAALAKPERWRERVRSLSALFYGFAAVSVLFAGILAAGGAWKDFWFYFWTYNVRYHVGLVPASDRILAFVRNLNDDGTYLHDNAALTFMTAAFLVWRRRWERTLGEDRGEAVGFVALWAVLAYAGSSLSGRGPGWGHYFFQVLPPFCVAAGLLVEAGIRELRSRLRVRALYSFPAVFLTLLFFYPFLTPWKGAEPRQFDGKLFPWIFPHPTLEERLRESSVDPQMQKLGDFLRGETSPKDTLFVWGFAPEVYVRSGIRPASRYIYCNPLTGLIPWINSDPRVDTRGQAIPGSWNLLMADLEASKPKFIVDTSYGGIGYYAKYPIHTYEPLHRLLQDHYTADSVTEGNWRIYRRTS